MPERMSSRTPPRAPFGAGPALNLQRKVGNRAFARLVHPPEPEPPPGPAAPPPPPARRWNLLLRLLKLSANVTRLRRSSASSVRAKREEGS